MRALGYLIVVTAIVCSANGLNGSLRLSSSRPSTTPSWTFPGGSCGSFDSSSNNVPKRAISNSAGLANFNSFAAGAAVGYLNYGSSKRPYHYSYRGYRYSGSCDFGESVCKARASTWSIEPTNKSLEADSTDNLIVVYWTCGGDEHCCDLDCCSVYKTSVTNDKRDIQWILWFIIPTVALALTLACLYAVLKRCEKRRMGSADAIYKHPLPFEKSEVDGSYGYGPLNAFVAPPPLPSTFHQQALSFPSRQPISSSGSNQPAAFNSPPTYNERF